MEGIVAHVQVLAAVPLNSDAITMVCVNVPLYQFVSFWESWFVRYDRTVRNNIPSARARCTTRSSGAPLGACIVLGMNVLCASTRAKGKLSCPASIF